MKVLGFSKWRNVEGIDDIYDVDLDVNVGVFVGFKPLMSSFLQN